MRQNYFNSNGRVFACLTDDGVLLKKEHEKDRLRILDLKGYAIDVGLLDEVIKAGGTQLEIRETTLSGSRRVYRVPLKDIQSNGKRLDIAGVQRYAIMLSWCALIAGSPEAWQPAERSKLLATQKEPATIREAVQGCLFSIAELQAVVSGRWL